MADIPEHLLHEVPPKFQGVYKRALAGSRPAAVKCMCLMCQGYEDGAVQAVRECAALGCPLHAVRPFQPKPPKDPNAPKGVFLGRRKGSEP